MNPAVPDPSEARPRPLLSVLTCVLNARDDFVLTATSLGNPLPAEVEWIVVDGGSTDGTLERVQCDPRQPRWLSEPDRGVYDAYNKALRLAGGDYVWYLNAGDTAYRDTLELMLPRLRESAGEPVPPLWCCGIHMSTLGRPWQAEPEKLKEAMSVPTPGVLAPRRALLDAGGFDEGFRVAADYDLWLRLKLAGQVPFVCESRLLAAYKGDGISTVYRHLALLEECVAQARRMPADSDMALLKAARHAVFDADLDRIRFSRWRLAMRLARRILY